MSSTILSNNRSKVILNIEGNERQVGHKLQRVRRNMEEYGVKEGMKKSHGYFVNDSSRMRGLDQSGYSVGR